MKILIFGLPGSGKSTLAQQMQGKLIDKGLKFIRINSDEMRSRYNDWDFSNEGRFRQADRIAAESELYENTIVDFVAPFREIRRNIIAADYEIWMNTVTSSQYPDTDSVFEEPLIHEVDDSLLAYPTNTTVDMIVHDIIEYYKQLAFSRS